ncbi:MAG TPA: class I SAM-dependent methyltransferase [Bryobacteraceae bacterium]|nr:class I SAM-dependent methyltransferase [Bryobacteraceae bacterium]
MESAELIAILREVRERVRARHPQGAAPGNVPLTDLLPLVHARDRAAAKVASIGTVNPRRGGPVNALVQAWKRLVARMLDWHVREQVVFNRQVMECVDAALEALNENNRALSELAGRVAAAVEHAEEMKDIRARWAEWHVEWERKLQQNEVQFLRSVADLQGAFQHRVTLMDASYRDAVRGQHADFEAALQRGMGEIWANLERMRMEYERLIHAELRIVRQRAQFGQPPLPDGRGSETLTEPRPSESGGSLPFDYTRFAERFRGSEEYVKQGQQFYLPYFAGRKSVLDIGCGRGEFLEMMTAAGVPARGIDLSEESVALCRQKGLDSQVADLFPYLAELPEGSLDGIFCSQVIEHLPPDRLPELVRLAASRLARDGVIALETPNPECLAIFATHFYIDPTHTRPVPHPLLVFYLEEFGIGGIEVRKLSPAVESMPALASLPEEFRATFFNGLDYAVIGRKL